jgi:hypothetical protein
MFPSLPRWVLQSALGIVLVGALNVAFSATDSVSGFQGTTAPQAKTSCAVDNGGCGAGVACFEGPTKAFCGACPTGYKTAGTKCEDINECVTNNGGCDPRTSCRNTPGSRMCGECPEGFAGTGEQGCTDVNETAKPDDITPPAVTTSGDVTVAATSEQGAVVKFTASATDRVDGARPVVCKPASGSTFAVGTTTVTCSASDTQGNRGTATLKVTVSKP